MSADGMSADTMAPALESQTVLIETLDGQGRVQHRHRLMLAPEEQSQSRSTGQSKGLGRSGSRTFTIGRSIDADVVVDDAYAAPLHAAVEIGGDGRVRVNDLGSRNGLLVAGKRHGPGSVVVDAAPFQIGQTRLRVRTAPESLPPEKIDQPWSVPDLQHPGWLAGLGLVAAMGQSVYASWLGAPRDLLGLVVATLEASAMTAIAWIAVWGLLSRIMRGEWRWAHHAAIFLAASTLYVAVDGVLDFAGFVLSLKPWIHQAAWLRMAALGGALYLQFKVATNLSWRQSAVIAGLLPAVWGGVNQWLQGRSEFVAVNAIDSRLHIYPPALRLRRAEPLDAYFTGTNALRATADKKRAAAIAANPDDDEK